MGKNLVTVVAAALVVGAAIWLGFHFFAADRTSGTSVASPQNGNATPNVGSVAEPELNAADISAIELTTSYQGYFDDMAECGKAGACQIRIRVDRALAAERVLSIGKGDEAKETTSRAKLSPEQFASLSDVVAANGAVKHWPEGMAMAVSNSSVRIEYGGSKSRTVPSNVDERASAYLPMIEAFKQLDRELNWSVSK
ncbi:MAG: hypothetical protein IT173_16705 [Acidobacteria bacterium]|nr:hypothetical protein [Acidobacteriota bacterium]